MSSPPIPAPPGRYFSRLSMTPVENGRAIFLDRPLEYRDDIRGFVVMMPALLKSDGASVPTIAWAALGATWLEWVEEGCLHDYLSRRGARIFLQPSGEPREVTCAEAARIFREALLAGGARPYAAHFAEWTVRAARPTYWHAKTI